MVSSLINNRMLSIERETMNKDEWIQAEYRAATETNERETA